MAAIEDDQARTMLLGQVLSQQAAVAVAERELQELGIDRPSLADIMAWTNASRKERERLALAWAAMEAIGYPTWKARQ